MTPVKVLKLNVIVSFLIELLVIAIRSAAKALKVQHPSLALVVDENCT